MVAAPPPKSAALENFERLLAAGKDSALLRLSLGNEYLKAGDPNGSGLPKWPKYSAANGETMILDDTCVAKNDPDREARKALPVLA